MIIFAEKYQIYGIESFNLARDPGAPLREDGVAEERLGQHGAREALGRAPERGVEELGGVRARGSHEKASLRQPAKSTSS